MPQLRLSFASLCGLCGAISFSFIVDGLILGAISSPFTFYTLERPVLISLPVLQFLSP